MQTAPLATNLTSADPPTMELTATPAPRPHLTLRPSRGWTALHLREIWAFRDLLFSLAGRDLKLRYKQTALGVIWVVVQPLLAAGVFSFVFGAVAKLPSGGIPYFPFAFAGLLGWTFFSNVLTKVGGCLVGNSPLISKVFFPRLVLPLASVGSGLVDLAVTAAMMAGLVAVYHLAPGAALLLFPVWLLVLTAFALGAGLWAAALAVTYRDVQYILPVMLNLLLYASPVAYTLAAVPVKLRWAYLLNPLTPPLEAMRASLLGTALPGAGALAWSALASAAVLLAGVFAFKRMERSFADVI